MPRHLLSPAVQRTQPPCQPWIRMLAASLLALALVGCKESAPPPAKADPAEQIARDQRVNDIHIWAREVTALEYEAVIAQFVDEFRRRKDRLAVLAQLPFREIRMSEPRESGLLSFQIHSLNISEPAEGSEQRWNTATWQSFLERLKSEGFEADFFRAEVTDFHPATPGSGGDVTTLHVEGHLKSEPTEAAPERPTRYAVIRGSVAATWEPSVPKKLPSTISSIRVLDLELLYRDLPPFFGRPRLISVGSPDTLDAVRVTPVIVEDLDGDFLPEIVLGGVNRVLRNRGDFRFESELFLPTVPSGVHHAAAMADFNGDGFRDFIGFRVTGEAFIVEGRAGGFLAQPRWAWEGKAVHPSILTVGDVDGDGDLDVWLGQDRAPYLNGKLPAPYDDADDGYPSKLFLNDGAGHFEDRTEASGLQLFRRVRSGSLLDMDGDTDLDLLVVSDHAGVELFINDGQGRFSNATSRMISEWKLLGQGHAIGQFDSDGVADLFVAGRWSNAVHRMDRMRLERSDFPDFREQATKLASGNRLFLSGPTLHDFLLEPEARRTGWTTGALAFDFDNDNDDDIYLTNGHLTGQSFREFDSQYWRHDVFLDENLEADVIERFFESPKLSPKLAALRSGTISWGGYEANRLLFNRGNAFSEIAYLFGVALNKDSRGAAAADFNGDGRLDLAVVAQQSFRELEHLAVKQSVLLYENRATEIGHWLGVHLEPNAPGYLRQGARVRISGDFGLRERVLVSGECESIQGPSSLHFGLAYHDKIDLLEVRWPNGRRYLLASPEIDRNHRVKPVLTVNLDVPPQESVPTTEEPSAPEASE